MSGGNTYPDCHIAYFQAAVTMDANSIFDSKTLFGLCQYSFSLFACQCFVSAVYQIIHPAAVVLAAYLAFKAGEGTALFVVDQAPA